MLISVHAQLNDHMVPTDINVFYYNIKAFNQVGWKRMQCEEVNSLLNQILTHLL